MRCVSWKNAHTAAAAAAMDMDGMRNHPHRHDVASLLHHRPWQRTEVPSLISSLTTTYKTVEMIDGVACPLAIPKQGGWPTLTHEHCSSDHFRSFTLTSRLIAQPPRLL